MPNNSSRFVNGSSRNRTSLGFFNVLGQGLLVFAAALAAMLAGGLGSLIVGVVILCPVFIAAMIGWERARPAVLSACAVLILFGGMEFAGLMPPPLAIMTAYTPWVFLSGAALTLLAMLLARSRVDVKVDPEPDLELDQNTAPYLVVSVSPHGRIRDLSGNPALLPGARLGKEIEPILKISRINPLRQIKTQEGDTLIFTDGDDETARSQSEGFEDIAGLGHDLKSPLTGILGFAQIMRDQDLGPDPSKYTDYPGLIHESGSILRARVEALLELIRADSGALDLDLGRVNLAAETDHCLRALRPQAQTANVELEANVTPDTQAYADSAAFGRILENLLTNAIKYTPDGGRVLVTSETFEGWTITSVTDQGTGIGAQDLSRLAEPFMQATHTGGREGTGLGLALVKRLVALQGGEFRIRSAEGFGTQMIVKLPAYAGQDTVRAAE